MTSFILKIIAVVTMFCDHFGYAFLEHFSFFNIIGRIAFPIFAFQISEGYIHTKDVKKYLIRLLIFAVTSQLPFYLFLQKFLPTSPTNFNIFFTLSLGLICIIIYDYFTKQITQKSNNSFLNTYILKSISILCVLFIAILAETLKTDYGFFGVIVIFAFYFFKNNKLAMVLSFSIFCMLKYGILIASYGFNWLYICNCIATIFPIIFIILYNGTQGKKIKYFLYAFYPLHLILLYLFF